MKQRLYSWDDDFTIQTADGAEAFIVDGRALSLGDTLSFQDLAGDPLACISQKLLSGGATYEMYRSGSLWALVSEKLFTFFRARFTVDVPGPDDLEAEGDFMDYEYRFTRLGQPVATVSKQWFSWTDSYGVDVADGEDDVMILAAAVVIDQLCHGGDAE
jgi:uncharacterized protein YxjI